MRSNKFSVYLTILSIVCWNVQCFEIVGYRKYEKVLEQKLSEKKIDKSVLEFPESALENSSKRLSEIFERISTRFQDLTTENYGKNSTESAFPLENSTESVSSLENSETEESSEVLTESSAETENFSESFLENSPESSSINLIQNSSEEHLQESSSEVSPSNSNENFSDESYPENSLQSSTEESSTESVNPQNQNDTFAEEFETTSTVEEDSNITNNFESTTETSKTTVPSSEYSSTSENPRRRACKCQKGVCACCTGPILQYFSRRACVKVRYIPDDFAFDIKMVMNNSTIYQNIVSGKNPRPLCANVPYLPIISLCAEFYDIYFIGRNMNICLDVTGNFRGNSVFRRTFSCLRFGSNGIKLSSPDNGIETYSGGTDAIIESGDTGYIDYDEPV